MKLLKRIIDNYKFAGFLKQKGFLKKLKTAINLLALNDCKPQK